MRKLDPPTAGSRSAVALGIPARAVEFESAGSAGAATTEDSRELIAGFAPASVDEDNGCGRSGAGCVSTGAGIGSLDAGTPASSETVDESGVTNGGISEGCDTRSVTGVKGVSLSLCPSQNPAEKKTPHIAVPARNSITSCPAEILFVTSSGFSPRPIGLLKEVYSCQSEIQYLRDRLPEIPIFILAKLRAPAGLAAVSQARRVFREWPPASRRAKEKQWSYFSQCPTRRGSEGSGA